MITDKKTYKMQKETKDAIEKAKEEDLIKKCKEWHKYIVIGLNKGLTHTIHDGRINDINWVRGRLELFESFSRCVMDTIWGNPFDSHLKELKEVAEEGYKK